MARGKTKYERAVEWIAWNDEPSEREPTWIMDMISVQVIAGTFQKDPMQVAMDVSAYRERQDI